CYLEGKTHEQAAQELGWSKGTVAGRLSRARELLGKRLARRGVTFPGGALAAGLSAGAAEAAECGRRVGALIGVLRGPAAGTAGAPVAAALAEGVLRTMFWTKTVWTALVVLAVGLAGLGAGWWAGRPVQGEATAAAEEPQRRPEAREARADDPFQQEMETR